MDANLTHESPYRRILFCTDFSDNANRAFDFALDAVVRRPGAVLYLLHVVPEADAQFWKTYIYEVENVDDKAKSDIDAALQEHCLSRVPEGVQVEVGCRVGKDYVEILRFAKEKDVDLIVLGRQGHSAIETVLFGNVTEKVARKAECAVLIVPRCYLDKGKPRQ